ncbi:DUF2589 domain-containing protein [Coleofasciculus sp. E1-EBD-02]|uniref:DUF2589 domain-containing protein n=1 Tax=Coleofasciculus sp. E1-EBD-02 TaxID=3068481 RepID=UPI0033049D74
MTSIPTNIVSLEYLFLAPLKAIIDADFMAARQFAAFVEEYGFTKQNSVNPILDGTEEENNQIIGKHEELGELRMISFSLNKAGEEKEVKIPALSLIPLPLLQVHDAEFKFGIRLLEGYEKKESKKLNLLSGGDENTNESLEDPRLISWRASIATQESSAKKQENVARHLQANIEAKVRIRRSDIPAGIQTLLAVMGENIQIEEKKKAKEEETV